MKVEQSLISSHVFLRSHQQIRYGNMKRQKATFFYMTLWNDSCVLSFPRKKRCWPRKIHACNSMVIASSQFSSRNSVKRSSSPLVIRQPIKISNIFLNQRTKKDSSNRSSTCYSRILISIGNRDGNSVDSIILSTPKTQKKKDIFNEKQFKCCIQDAHTIQPKRNSSTAPSGTGTVSTVPAQ